MRAAWILFIAGCAFQAQATAADGTSGAGGAGPPPDAGFAFASCPTTYTTVLPGLPASPEPSRYRLIASGGKATDQIAACNGDLQGATHLIVLDSMPELIAVAALVDGMPDKAIAHNAVWVGGVQQKTALLPDQSWLGFDDNPLPDQWAPGEPNDGGGDIANTELDHHEQFVLVERGKHYLTDSSRDTSSGALCECDGKPVGPMAVATIDSNR